MRMTDFLLALVGAAPGRNLVLGLPVAQGLTLTDGRVQARAVSAWRQARTDDNALGRAPAVFAIGP